MEPKLDIDATKLADGSWKFEVRHSGSNRAGRYMGTYTPSANDMSLTSISGVTYPLVMSTQCNSVADAFETIADYFERHGCL